MLLFFLVLLVPQMKFSSAFDLPVLVADKNFLHVALYQGCVACCLLFLTPWKTTVLKLPLIFVPITDNNVGFTIR